VLAVFMSAPTLIRNPHCVVPENILTQPMEGYQKFQRGERSQWSKLLKESMKLNWNFRR